MGDPLDALRDGDAPVAPDPAFAIALRRRLEVALEPPPPANSRSTTMAATETETRIAAAIITPRLSVRRAAEALAFYAEAFGAVETMRIVQDDGRIGHAEVTIGGAKIQLADEFPELGFVGPESNGGTSVTLSIDLADVDIDAFVERAVAAGATVLRPVANQFYGSRSGQVLDPFGHRWNLATQIEHLTDEEIVRRAASQDPTLEEEAANQVDLGTRAGARATVVSDTREGNLGYVTLDLADLDRGKAFFGALLGWRFEGEPESTSAHIGNVDPPMGMVGGMAAPRPTLYFRVGDIQAALARTRELGGEGGEPTLSDSGWSADCTDDQGSRFALWQPAEGY